MVDWIPPRASSRKAPPGGGSRAVQAAPVGTSSSPHIPVRRSRWSRARGATAPPASFWPHGAFSGGGAGFFFLRWLRGSDRTGPPGLKKKPGGGGVFSREEGEKRCQGSVVVGNSRPLFGDARFPLRRCSTFTRRLFLPSIHEFRWARWKAAPSSNRQVFMGCIRYLQPTGVGWQEGPNFSFGGGGFLGMAQEGPNFSFEEDLLGMAPAPEPTVVVVAEDGDGRGRFLTPSFARGHISEVAERPHIPTVDTHIPPTSQPHPLSICSHFPTGPL